MKKMIIQLHFCERESNEYNEFVGICNKLKLNPELSCQSGYVNVTLVVAKATEVLDILRQEMDTSLLKWFDKSAIVISEGKRGWDGYFLHQHYDNDIKVDSNEF